MATAGEASAEVKPYQEMSGSEAAVKAIYKRSARGVNSAMSGSSRIVVILTLPGRRACRWPFEHICILLLELIKHSPGNFGYQRSRWSTELLAIKINEITGCQLHAGTVRRWLPSTESVWCRAAPTLRIRDPHKEEKMAAIHDALEKCSVEHPVIYEDEVDIHLDPKIGADWHVRGQQKRVYLPPMINAVQR